MKKYFFIFLLVILSFVFENPQVRANLISTFDSGDEGWRVFNRAPDGTPGNPSEYVGSYQGTGGNPGGFFKGTDTGLGATGFFVSPINWAGNWSQYIGGTLQFDLKLIYTNPEGHSSLFPYYDVLIYTDADHYAYSKFGVNPSEGVWTSYQRQLIESNFTVIGGNFGGILSNVTGIRIIGEFWWGPETVGLDNVRVSAVPEPSTMLLLGSGLLGLIGLRRKSKK